jgi:multiple sugar transport system substrate-binding protein
LSDKQYFLEEKEMKKILMMLAVLALLSACSRPAKDGGKSSDGVVTLTIWGWDNNVTDVTIPAFEASHPNIKIERLAVPSAEMPVKYQQSLAAGLEMPDILLAEINQRYQTFALDIWEDLGKSPYNITGAEFFDYDKSLISNSKGQIIAIDQTLCPSGMAYKKGLTKKYFGTDDRKELEAVFSSLDAFVQKGAELAKASGGTVYMFASPAEVLEWMKYSSKIKLVDSGGSVNYTGKMREGIDFLVKLRDAGAVDALDMWSPQESASFSGDNHIFYTLPNWGVQYRIKANDPNGQGRWGLMVPPTGPFNWGGTVQGIYKNSKHKAEVWEYIKWFSFSKEGVDVVKKGTDYFTPVKQFYDDPGYVGNLDPFFGIDTGDYFYKDLVPRMAPPEFTAYDNYLMETNNAVAAYIMGNKSVTLMQALAKGVEEMKSRITTGAAVK